MALNTYLESFTVLHMHRKDILEKCLGLPYSSVLLPNWLPATVKYSRYLSWASIKTKWLSIESCYSSDYMAFTSAPKKKTVSQQYIHTLAAPCETKVYSYWDHACFRLENFPYYETEEYHSSLLQLDPWPCSRCYSNPTDTGHTT